MFLFSLPLVVSDLDLVIGLMFKPYSFLLVIDIINFTQIACGG